VLPDVPQCLQCGQYVRLLVFVSFNAALSGFDSLPAVLLNSGACWRCLPVGPVPTDVVRPFTPGIFLDPTHPKPPPGPTPTRAPPCTRRCRPLSKLVGRHCSPRGCVHQ
jgi:hypothetical protein